MVGTQNSVWATAAMDKPQSSLVISALSAGSRGFGGTRTELLLLPTGSWWRGGLWWKLAHSSLLFQPSLDVTTFFHLNSRARIFISHRGLQDSLAHLPLDHPLPHGHTHMEILPLQVPPCLSTAPMKRKPGFLQKLSFPTFALTAMRRGDVLGGEMFPVGKDHITEVYLCLLLCCASFFFSLQSPFLWFRPYWNRCTSFALCWAPNRGNICTPKKPNEKLYLYFAGMGRLNSLPAICKWPVFSLSLTLVVPTGRWQTFTCHLTK